MPYGASDFNLASMIILFFLKKKLVPVSLKSWNKIINKRIGNIRNREMRI